MKRALRHLITLALVSACALTGITENERNITVNAAITLFKQRNYDGVIAKLSPIAPEINDIKPAVLCLAESYYYKKKFVSAEKLYAQVLSLTPDADEEMTVLTALGNIYVATKDFARGIPMFEKLLAKKPNDIILTFNIAVLYKFKGEIPLAVKYLETVLAADPGYVDAVKYLVAIHQEANDEEKAIAVLSSALAKAKSPAIQSIYNNIVIGRNFRLGNQYFERKEYQFAVKMFEEIIAIDPTATGVIFKLANAYFNNSDYEKALVSLKKLETNRDIIGDAENAYPFFKLLALTLYQLKQHDALTETGKKALAYNPGDYDILRALGRGYEMRGDYAKAIAQYSKAVEIKQDFRVLHWLSVLLAKERRYADAMQYLARAVNNGYKDADAVALYKDVSIAYYTGLGNDIYKEVKDAAVDAKARAKLDAAAGHYRKALEVERRPVILISLANTAILRQQFGEAETLLTEARTIDNNNVSAYLSLARLYSEQKLPKQQAAVLAELEKLSSSGNPDVIYQIAVNYEQSGDQAKAFDLFTKVRSNAAYTARANEHLGVITYNRAVLSFNEKKLDEAERLFREIVQYQPESKDAAFGLRKVADERKRRTLKETIIAADTAFDNADYAAAITRYESALAVDDTLRTVALNLASSYFKTKNYYNAVSTAQNLLTKNPKDKEALVILARAATRLNDIKNAEIYFKRALAIDNNDGDVHRYLGELNRDRGDTDTAIREFKIAKELALKDIENYKVDAAVLLGNIYYSKGSYDMAMNEYLDVLKTTPGQPAANFNLGFIYYKKNNLTKALEHITKAKALASSPVYKMNLGKVLFYMQDYGTALEQFRAAYALMKNAPVQENIDYKWWYAKTLAAQYKTRKTEYETVLALLDECIVNRVNERVSYLARLEKLAIDGKTVSAFYNNARVDVQRMPSINGDRQFFVTADNELMCQELETEITVWRTNDNVPLSSSLAVGAFVFYGLENKTLIARRIDNGEKAWEVRDFYADRYVAADNTLICVGPKNELVAFRDGSKAWTRIMPEGKPYTMHLSGGTLFVLMKNDLVALKPANGETILAVTDSKAALAGAVRTTEHIAVFSQDGGRTLVTVYKPDGTRRYPADIAVEGVMAPVMPVASGTTATFALAARLVSVSMSLNKVLWNTETGKIDSLAHLDGKLYAVQGRILKQYAALNGAVSATFPVAADDGKYMTIYAKK